MKPSQDQAAASVGDEASRGWVLCGLKVEPGPDGSKRWRAEGDVPISNSEVEAASESIRVLTEDSEQAQLNLVLWNFREFMSYHQILRSEFRKAIHGSPNPVLRVQTELAVRLFNWLQSMRAYLDHTETRLKKRYGRESDHVKAFKEVTGREFDEIFAYRFFAKLRNYGHIGFPALVVNITERAPIGEHRQVRTVVVFDRDALLANFDSWGKVQRDLRAQPAQFDVVPLMVDMMQSLETVRAGVAVIEFELLARSVEVLIDLRERIRGIEGRPTLMNVRVVNGIPKHMQMIDIPPFELPEPSTVSGDEGPASVESQPDEGGAGAPQDAP